MTRPRPVVRVRLAWLLAGLMLSVTKGDWAAAKEQAVEVLDLLAKVLIEATDDHPCR